MNPILVTGSHRSGTTWVGKMLALHPSIFYIHEPFNPAESLKNGFLGIQFNYWFTHFNESTCGAWKTRFQTLFGFRYPKLSQVFSPLEFSHVKKMARHTLTVRSHRYQKMTPLVKDPIALFSAEWLATTFNMNVIVLIRHPAAFVSSIKMLGWRFPFSDFLNQPLLMKTYLAPFEQDIRDFSVKATPDIVDEAILLWNIFHHVIQRYQSIRTDWTFVRHEDLSRAPMKKFEDLYKKLNLEYSSRIQETIKEYTHNANPSDPQEWKMLKRNSEENTWNWKKRLDKHEIRRVRDRTEELASTFYGEADW